VNGYEFPEKPELEDAFNAAWTALAKIPGVRADHAFIDQMSISELIMDLRYLVGEAEIAASSQLGALISWKAPHETAWEPVIAGIDLDGGGHDFGVTLGRDACEGPHGDWTGSALHNAALAYKRACGWDFAPGQSGIWLLMLAPASGMGNLSWQLARSSNVDRLTPRIVISHRVLPSASYTSACNTRIAV
jgi:hypothetical protein